MNRRLFAGGFEAAGALAGQFLAVRLNAHAFELRLEAQATGNAVVQKSNVLILKFHHPVTVEADQMVMLRLFEEIRVIVGLIAAQIDLTQYATGLH